MRLLPILLHAVAAKLQFGADANNTRKGSKRRRNIERVYAVARKALPLEEKLEAEERWERARLLGRNRKARLASIKVKVPRRNFSYAVPDPKKLLDIRAYNLSASSSNGTAMNARHYLTMWEQAKNSVEMQEKLWKMNNRAAPQDRIGLFVKRGSWDSDGFASLGRLLGVVVGIPLRIVVFVVRRCCVRPLRDRCVGTFCERYANFTDDALRRGFAKAVIKAREETVNELNQVIHRYEGPIERFFARYYGLLVLNTREIRIVLKTAWRLPRQAWLFLKTLRYYAMLYLRSTRSLNYVLVKAYPAARSWPRHERLEAALLRALLAECRAYEARLGPKAAARRRRRLAKYHEQLRLKAEQAKIGSSPRDEV